MCYGLVTNNNNNIFYLVLAYCETSSIRDCEEGYIL